MKKDIIKQIQINYRTSEIIKKYISCEKNVIQKMELIKYLIYFNVNHFTGRYSDEWIEEQLAEIGKEILFVSKKSVIKNTNLLIMTRAGESGGHTRIVNNWLKVTPHGQNTLLFTDSDVKQVPKFLMETIRKTETKLLFLKKRNELEKAEELLQLSDGFEKIILHIHMYDIVPLLAYSNLNWKRPVIFYNHANFLFSIGISISDEVWCICDYDKEKAIRYRGAKKASVLFIDDEKEKMEIDTHYNRNELKQRMCKKYGLQPNEKIIVSMGSDFKYSKIQECDFVKFAEEIIRERLDLNFIIVGADPKKKKWKEFEKHTNHKGRALGILPYQEFLDWMKIADAYIPSFPMVSGGQFEAMKLNVPMFIFSLIKRENNSYRNCLYHSITEMKEDIIQLLKNELDITNRYSYGKQEKYCLEYKLKEKLDQVERHNYYHFKSKRCISKEEIVNFQLLSTIIQYPYVEMNKLSFRNRGVVSMIDKLYQVESIINSRELYYGLKEE